MIQVQNYLAEFSEPAESFDVFSTDDDFLIRVVTDVDPPELRIWTGTVADGDPEWVIPLVDPPDPEKQPCGEYHPLPCGLDVDCPETEADDETDDGDGGGSMTIRKKPVEVEAERVEQRREIDTREGTLVAEPGDYVITGVEGEKYPIDPEIMAETYQPVDDEAKREWDRRFAGGES